ncbi:MAG TPA: hypothetical protein VF773_12025, partial [Verrucomicrobiae bacterium]
MRRKRSDSKLFNLDEAQQAQLAEMLLSGLPYHKVREVIAKPTPEGFGVTVSISAFTPFWDEVCRPLYLARRARAVGMAKEIGDDARKRPGQFDAATIDALEQKALEVAISPHADPRDVKAIYTLV